MSSGSVAYFESISQEILALMDAGDFKDNMLSELYLPGYYCQREEIRRYKGKNENEKSGGNENE